MRDRSYDYTMYDTHYKSYFLVVSQPLANLCSVMADVFPRISYDVTYMKSVLNHQEASFSCNTPVHTTLSQKWKTRSTSFLSWHCNAILFQQCILSLTFQARLQYRHVSESFS